MSFIPAILIALISAPLIPGIVNRTKALCAGRRGQPLLQTYYDIWKLMRKGEVVSDCSSWIFQFAPGVNFMSSALAIVLIPVASSAPLFSFGGDIILFASFLAIGRFSMILAAMDTGSSFEGMGASREAWISALSEPSIFLCFAALAAVSGKISVAGALTGTTADAWMASAPALCLVVISFFVISLAENSRIPFDDPNTHLELTMVHEVMVLDYSGPNLGLVFYASSLKLFAFSAIIVNVVFPFDRFSQHASFMIFMLGIFAVSVCIGLVESLMARLRMTVIPQLLAGAGALAFIAFLISMRA